MPPTYDEGSAGGIWVNPDSRNTATLSSDRAVSGSKSLKLDNPYDTQSGRLALTTDMLSTTNPDFYQSYWIYLDKQYNLDHNWWQFWEIRESGSGPGDACGVSTDGSHISIYLWGSAPNLNWVFVKGQQPSGFTKPVSFSWEVTKTTAARYTNDPGNYPDSYVVANPHEVPWDRWFKLDIYLHRGSKNDGIFKVWITDPEKNVTDKLLFSVENSSTSCTFGYPGYDSGTQPAILKQYGWRGVAYYDDIYLYNINPRAVSMK